MENKKSKSANLEKSRRAFLMIGLAIATGLVLMAFEWNTITYKESLEAKNNDTPYDIPFTAPTEITYLIEPVEQPKVEDVNNEIIEVTEDIVEAVEEKDNDDEVIEITVPPITTKFKSPWDLDSTNTVSTIDYTPKGPVNLGPGTNIDVPYYDYCKDQSYDEKIACISKEIHKSIGEGMSNVTAYQIETNKASKMYVQFVIGKDGLIQDLEIAGEENFNKSIVKMVKESMTKVPQMFPAMKNGMPVSVYFSIPINFNIQ